MQFVHVFVKEPDVYDLRMLGYCLYIGTLVHWNTYTYIIYSIQLLSPNYKFIVVLFLR